MAKKIRRMRTFARTASKSMEKKLVENAKKLTKDPYLILPEYNDNYSRKHIGKTKKKLDKVHRFKDDTKKLEKLAKKKSLDGALAGTMLVAHSEKAPYLAVAQFPTGNIAYAQRGNAEKEKLVAVQHFDDPVLRLLGVKNIALNKGLHIYSWDDGFISTGLEAKPPKDFVHFVINKTGLPYKNGVATCKHISTESAKKKEFLKKNYLYINWKSADAMIAICEGCAKSTENTLFSITKYLLEPKIADDFVIDVIAQVIKDAKSKPKDETLYIAEYLSGELTDYQFIKKNAEQREESLKKSGEKILILDGISYGVDAKRFITMLKPNKSEQKGLELILERIEGPVVLTNATPNRVLELYWKKYGLEVINSILHNKEMAEKFFSLDDTPSNILEMTFKYKETQQILSQLPRYDLLPPLAKFADHIARTYKTFGKRKTLGEIKKRPDDPKGKSIAYAFLLVFGKDADKKWQFSSVEVEYGEFLKEYAEKLLCAKPDKYHDALQNLLSASGFTEEIKPIK